MKNIFSAISIISVFFFFLSCNQGNKTTENNPSLTLDPSKELWAGLVESKTILVKPESWDDEYWAAVYKDMDQNKLFNTIVESVLSGKKEAYDLFTDSLLTLAQVNEKLVFIDLAKNIEKKITGADLSLLRMREKWVFDKEKFKLSKEITRIDLIIKKLDNFGDYVGDKGLFYINL